MRNLEYWIHWFTSTSDMAFTSPPSAPWPEYKGLEHHDLFLHRRGKETKAWRYDAAGEGRWERLIVGGLVRVPDLEGDRTFVINKQGKPSYVLEGTVAKLYGGLAKK